MKEFEIDVSGEDILSKNYSVCVADKDSIIKGFKFSEEIVNNLCSRYGQGLYRYKKSKKRKADLKIRVYCVAIYYIFKSINMQGSISLKLCRDFDGREDDIRKELKLFLEKKLNLDLDDRIYFLRLNPESNAHKYAYLMRVDNKNRMSTYIEISLDDFEKWLKK